MNILFADKLSATAWHHTSMCDSTNYLDHWLLRLMHHGWCDRDTDHPDGEPLFTNQHGHVGVLCISVDVSSIEREDELLKAGEFNWAIYAVPVDNCGQYAGSIHSHLTPDNRLILGGLINHGSSRDQSWSSHT